MIGNGAKRVHRQINLLNSSAHLHLFRFEFKGFGIGSGQVSVLRALQSEDGVNQEKLAAIFRVNKATAARAIDKLVREGYVIRKKDEADNRAYKLYLTEKGREIEPKLKSIFQQLTGILSSGLTEDEKRTVIRLQKRCLRTS